MLCLNRFASLLRALAAALLLLSATGCATSDELRRFSEVGTSEARRLHEPALRCRIEEPLATFETHLAFTKHEMQRGKVLDAERHMAIAKESLSELQEALDPRPECFNPNKDSDGDGINDNVDNCPTVPNPDQRDLDADKFGDACDPDMDGDGIPNQPDNCPAVANNDQRDTDLNGIGDACSDDRDGDTIKDTADRCPEQPEDRDTFEDTDGCPDLDNDQDGVTDQADACPLVPEDTDGFEDFDGCPELDNDQDTIPDATDACMDEPEDFDGDEDTDGCPEESKALVRVTAEQIEIKQQINFETDSARIKGAVSFQVLDAVAGIMMRYPEMQIRIEGHTDDRGRDAHNLQLSQSRAESVRAYLVQAGVDLSRFEAQGFGETNPLQDNATADGRTANRRVEFHILKR